MSIAASVVSALSIADSMTYQIRSALPFAVDDDAITDGTNGGNWKIEPVLDNTGDKLRTIGGALMIVIGVVMVIVGIFKIAQGLISHGKTQVNWVINILLILVGAVFCAGGALFTMMTQESGGLGDALANELKDLGTANAGTGGGE